MLIVLFLYIFSIVAHLFVWPVFSWALSFHERNTMFNNMFLYLDDENTWSIYCFLNNQQHNYLQYVDSIWIVTVRSGIRNLWNHFDRGESWKYSKYGSWSLNKLTITHLFAFKYQNCVFFVISMKMIFDDDTPFHFSHFPTLSLSPSFSLWSSSLKHVFRPFRSFLHLVWRKAGRMFARWQSQSNKLFWFEIQGGTHFN